MHSYGPAKQYYQQRERANPAQYRTSTNPAEIDLWSQAAWWRQDLQHYNIKSRDNIHLVLT